MYRGGEIQLYILNSGIMAAIAGTHIIARSRKYFDVPTRSHSTAPTNLFIVVYK
jgi:hypothetical protein